MKKTNHFFKFLLPVLLVGSCFATGCARVQQDGGVDAGEAYEKESLLGYLPGFVKISSTKDGAEALYMQEDFYNEQGGKGQPFEEASESESLEEEKTDGEFDYLASALRGDIVPFGSYEQDNDIGNGPEPIMWHVLEKKDGVLTLLAVNILDNQPYHLEGKEPEINEYGLWDTEPVPVTWEDSTLRKWANNDFYFTAFNEREAERIADWFVENSPNPFYGTWGGNGTEDKVYFLSLEEIEKYFGIPMTSETNIYYNTVMEDEDAYERYRRHSYECDYRILATPTDYAIARGAYVFSQEEVEQWMEELGYDFSYAEGSGSWWLRSPGMEETETTFVHDCGVEFSGYFGFISNGIRPVIRVFF